MLLFPAIDLKDGKCVRLRRGDMEDVTVFSEHPAAQAESFEEQGAKWLHLVDLNGAFEARPVNIDVVKSILKAVSIPVQLGGGIRGMQMIETWLEAGVARVILGTAALKNPVLVKEACLTFPGQIVVGLDGRGGKVAVEGWAETSKIEVKDAAMKFEDAGVAAIIYTDIEKDGMMKGPNIEATRELAETISTPVIASGGISSLDDLRAIKAIESFGVAGVISGRAIYDGKISIEEANKILED